MERPRIVQSRRGSAKRVGAIGVALLATAALGAAPAAADPPDPDAYQARDGQGFRNILPPGQRGFAGYSQIFEFLFPPHTRPPHNNDQFDEYRDLPLQTPIDQADVNTYFKDASFGVPAGDTSANEYTPNCAIVSAPSSNSPHCDDVTIVRDSDYAVPHIYGTDRAAALFGSGYAAAEDRLFMMDVERHLARGTLSSLTGGSNAATDRGTFSTNPYTEADLQAQYDNLNEELGADGEQGQQDITNYVDGINQYIAEARVGPAVTEANSKIPGEYALATNQPTGPDAWNVADVAAIASLVGSQFGNGGGREIQSALALQAAQAQYGAADGKAVWSDFREADDPETPTTVHDTSFPYGASPANPVGVAMPDAGTLQTEPLVPAKAKRSIDPQAKPMMGGFLKQRQASNALLVSDAESTGDHPIAVFGPQVGYFSPRILVEQDIHAPATVEEGPALDARGAGFAGVSLYVLLGRGQEYSWSATSAGQDITDKYAMHLCDPAAPADPPTLDDGGYWFNDACTPFEEVSRTVSWQPTPQDPTAAGSQTMTVLRTKLGTVSHRAMVGGQPVAYVTTRSTYMHDLTSAAGFADFNSPDKVSSPETFQQAAHKIGFTFNWFYTDPDQVAYFNSGDNPVRPSDVSGDLPVDAPKTNTLQHVWEGWDPLTRTADYTPFAQHPQVIDQDYISSWNGKQAPGFRASDADWSHQPIDRVDMLDSRIEDGIAGAETMTLPELVEAMIEAATVDLRGAEMLPLALRLAKPGIGELDIGKQARKKMKKAVAKLQDWNESGAHRIDTDKDYAYEQSKAIRIMDAWFPRLVQAEFEPSLGTDLYAAIQQVIPLDNAPRGGGGSAYNEGWYGYVDKDLRSVLGDPVEQPYSREYCGGGNKKKCQKVLAKALKQALANMSDEDLYPGFPTPACTDNYDPDPSAQWCQDTIRSRTIGAITQPPMAWQNRPTFQQAVEVQNDVP